MTKRNGRNHPKPSGKIMEFTIPTDTVAEFSETLKQADGLDINICYQCQKCTSGCPVAYAMDYTPAQLIHAIRLGLKDVVLNSATIWLCASCQTCTTRCPQELDLAKVMDALKMMAMQSGIEAKIPDVAAFYRTGLTNILFFGRMCEPALMAMLKLSTGQLAKDLDLGIKMIRKEKLKLLPDFRGALATRRILSRVKKQERV